MNPVGALVSGSAGRWPDVRTLIIETYDANVKDRCAAKPAAALAFLGALCPDPPDGYLLLWNKDGKRSLRFPSPDHDAIAEAAVNHTARTDVYIGCALSPSDNGPKLRCKADEARAIPGLWADIDIRGPAHKGKDLSPDIDSAMSVVRASPRRRP